MAHLTTTDTAVQPALLFMPDISGFTSFVSNTEILHAQNIVQEVLEVIINSNQMDLQVSEIEGDAVFFYRLGSPPSFQELLQQVQTMFTRFHQHLRLYSVQRICPCEACISASKLKLKIVAHFGEVAGIAVNNQRKLFGKDVIMLHRLLKNNIDKDEYFLLTESLVNNAVIPQTLPLWFVPVDASEQYDVGQIKLKVCDLSLLRSNLPATSLPLTNKAADCKTAFAESAIIHAPIETVFTALFDLNQRVFWMPGVKGVTKLSPHRINRMGTTHRCLLDADKSFLLVTDYAQINESGAELIEMDRKGAKGWRYKVKPLANNETKLTVEALVKKNFFLEAGFNLFIKNKMRKDIISSFANLNRYLKPAVGKTEIVGGAAVNVMS